MYNGQQKQEISGNIFDVVAIFKNVSGIFAKKAKTDIVVNEAMKEEIELQNAINEAMNEMELANNQFENAESSEHVQVSIFQLNAAQTKYQYLIRLAKERKLKSTLKSSNF